MQRNRHPGRLVLIALAMEEGATPASVMSDFLAIATREELIDALAPSVLAAVEAVEEHRLSAQPLPASVPVPHHPELN